MIAMCIVLNVVLWVVKFNPEDVSSVFFQNAGNHLQCHMATQPRRPQSTSRAVRPSDVRYAYGCFSRFAQVEQRL